MEASYKDHQNDDDDDDDDDDADNIFTSRAS
jgi:hypothetical protein